MLFRSVPTATGTTRKIWANTVTIGTTLAAGTYWFDWNSAATNAGAHFQPSKTIAGARGAAGDNGRQLTVATGIWADAIDLGTPATAPDVIQDFPFDVVGVPGPVPQAESESSPEAKEVGLLTRISNYLFGAS